MGEVEFPNILYHYTQQTAFLEIIRTKKIWATDVLYLNDSAEMRHAWTILDSLLKNPGIDRDLEEEDLIKDFYRMVGNLNLGQAVFVTSFSGARNQLSQWRAYGSEAGFSIGFDVNELRTLSNDLKLEFWHCIYQREEQEEMMRKIIELALEKYGSGDKDKPGGIIHLRKKMALLTFAVNFLKLAPRLKDSSFSDEREYRVIFWSGNLKRKMSFRKGRSTIIPYIELDLPQNNGALSIKEVLVGPTPNPELAVAAVKKFITEEGMNPEIVKYCDIPYRSLGM